MLCLLSFIYFRVAGVGARLFVLVIYLDVHPRAMNTTSLSGAGERESLLPHRFVTCFPLGVLRVSYVFLTNIETTLYIAVAARHFFLAAIASSY